MHFKLACADFAFPLLSHDDALDLIRRLGVTGVDVGVFPRGTHFGPAQYLEDPQGGARKLSELARRHDLELADIFLQSGPDLQSLAENHPDPQQRQQSRDVFLRTLELAVHCNAKHMTSLPGITWPADPPGDSLARSADELAWRAEQARSAGVVYAVEPHMWSVAPTPEAALRLVELAPGLTITLDCGHYVAQGFADEQIKPLVPHASHVHARAACPGLLQTSLAKNTIDFGSLLRSLAEADYRGWIGIEYVRLSGVAVAPEVDNLAETILMRKLLEQESSAIHGP